VAAKSTLEDRINDEYLGLGEIHKDLRRPIKEKNGFSIRGNLGLIDPFTGNLWDKYQIKIYIPFNYPHNIPSTYELGKKIDWKNENHIDSEGKCCLAPRLEEYIILGKEYFLIDYINKLVIPFFASHKLKELRIDEGIGEYSHFGAGIIEYYEGKFGTKNIDTIIESLNILSGKKHYERNEKCFCGSGEKYKNCHLKKLNDYQIFDRRIFLEDLRDIEKIVNK